MEELIQRMQDDAASLKNRVTSLEQASRVVATTALQVTPQRQKGTRGCCFVCGNTKAVHRHRHFEVYLDDRCRKQIETVILIPSNSNPLHILHILHTSKKWTCDHMTSPSQSRSRKVLNLPNVASSGSLRSRTLEQRVRRCWRKF